VNLRNLYNYRYLSIVRAGRSESPTDVRMRVSRVSSVNKRSRARTGARIQSEERALKKEETTGCATRTGS